MQKNYLQFKLRDYYRDQRGYGDELQFENFIHIQAGWENEIYAFDLQTDGNEPQTLFLRIYPGADALEKSEREFNNIKRLASVKNSGFKGIHP